MKNADSFLSAMNKYFVFNNLCGIAAGTAIFIYDVRRSKSSISDKDVPHFQIFAEMRRCTVVFSKTWKYDMILSIKCLFRASLFSGFRKISSVLLPVLSW